MHTRLLDSKVICLTNVSNLVDRINKLNPDRKILDISIYNLYNKVKEESINLINTSNKKGRTEFRKKIEDIYNLIREIFTEKLDTATGVEDMPPLETEEEAE